MRTGLRISGVKLVSFARTWSPGLGGYRPNCLTALGRQRPDAAVCESPDMLACKAIAHGARNVTIIIMPVVAAGNPARLYLRLPDANIFTNFCVCMSSVDKDKIESAVRNEVSRVAL